jgi:membrane-associated phospholipid phosphatase
MKKIATFVSRILDPFLVMTVVALVGIRRSTLTTHAQIIFLITAFVLMIGIPAALLALSVKKKWISNWDMSIRSERPKALLIMLAIELLSLIILKPMADAFLFSFLVLVIVWSIGFSIITHYWKISGHSGISALGSGLLVSWFGFSVWPVLLIVPIVSWSRVVRKNHTILQVIIGAIYSWSLILILHKFI